MELCQGDSTVAEAAELPLELAHFAVAARADPSFDDSCDEWLEWLVTEQHDAFDCPIVLLALEQSAYEGVLLPWAMRGVRLADADTTVVEALHYFWTHCPKHVAAYLTNYVYWLVRSERGRRRHTPVWSPRTVAGASAASTGGPHIG